MSALSDLQASVAALDSKVTAHLDADGAAVLEMTRQNEVLQAKVAELQAIIDTGPSGVSDEDLVAVKASLDAVSARL